jgi:hypothetical protein
MTIVVRSNEPKAAPEATPEAKEATTLSALEETTSEQNESTESDTEETEAKESPETEGEESETDSESKDDGKEKTVGKKKGGFQRRIDKLNAQKSAIQQEAEYWKQMALKSAGAQKDESKPVDQTKPATADGKPKADDFDTHAEFVEALTDWKTEQKLSERDQKLERSKLQTEQAKLVQTFTERREAFLKTAPDYDEVMESVDDVPLTPALREIILTSENGPEIAYELAKNRDEFERISKLSPLAVAREVGKLESRLSAKSSDGKTEQKKITKAPKPIDPVNAGGKGSAAKSIADPNLSQAEYERLRKEQMKRKGA